jgi:hypothetical protein
MSVSCAVVARGCPVGRYRATRFLPAGAGGRGARCMRPDVAARLGLASASYSADVGAPRMGVRGAGRSGAGRRIGPGDWRAQRGVAGGRYRDRRLASSAGLREGCRLWRIARMPPVAGERCAAARQISVVGRRGGRPGKRRGSRGRCRLRHRGVGGPGDGSVGRRGERGAGRRPGRGGKAMYALAPRGAARGTADIGPSSRGGSGTHDSAAVRLPRRVRSPGFALRGHPRDRGQRSR